MFPIDLHFHDELVLFLPKDLRGHGVIRRVLTEKAAIKDVIEACGVPHTEVDLIVVRAKEGEALPVGLSWQVQDSVSLEVYPVPAGSELFASAPRLQPRRATGFIADGHLGKLARNLRLLGVDTAYERDANDPRLLEIMVKEDRALLTRDRRLLMHSIVRIGYCPRSADPMEQTNEVIRRFFLKEGEGGLAPYRRCLSCNGPLDPVGKAEVIQALSSEPLTLRYYDDFKRCSVCGKVYWPGTHFQKLQERVLKLLG